MSLTEKIPFLDLVTPHQELEPELTAVFQKVLQTAGFRRRPDGRRISKTNSRRFVTRNTAWESPAARTRYVLR